MRIDEVMALNHGLKPDLIMEGQTIVLPAGSLSARDKKILGGIGPKSYRTYPVRKGEKISAILKARKISMAEAEKLNPGVNLKHITEGQVLKLPAGKYTVREQEMMMGTARAPQEFFAEAGPYALAGLAGALAGAFGVYMFMKQYISTHPEDAASDGEDE
jgi:LysM repeat protein